MKILLLLGLDYGHTRVELESGRIFQVPHAPWPSGNIGYPREATELHGAPRGVFFVLGPPTACARSQTPRQSEHFSLEYRYRIFAHGFANAYGYVLIGHGSTWENAFNSVRKADTPFGWEPVFVGGFIEQNKARRGEGGSRRALRASGLVTPTQSDVAVKDTLLPASAGVKEEVDPHAADPDREELPEGPRSSDTGEQA
jgi:hypothetical protein